MSSRLISPQLIRRIRDRYQLDWRGIHGPRHWARVRVNGLRLAEETGANIRVVESFAFLHDTCRVNDGTDPDHGLRASHFAQEINQELLGLGREELDLLILACEGHTAGGTEAEITVQTLVVPRV